MTPPEGSVTTPFSPLVGVCAARFSRVDKIKKRKTKPNRTMRTGRKLIRSPERLYFDVGQRGITVWPLPRRPRCLGSMAKELWTRCSWGMLPEYAHVHQAGK